MNKKKQKSSPEQEKKVKDSLESPAAPEPKKNKKYVAVKNCSHLDDRCRVGEEVPNSWPESAINYLLEKEAIKLME